MQHRRSTGLTAYEQSCEKAYHRHVEGSRKSLEPVIDAERGDSFGGHFYPSQSLELCQVNPIQTRHGGRFFRTRGEARYVVFFDACQLRYEYEKEGFCCLRRAASTSPTFGCLSPNVGFEVNVRHVPDLKALLKCHCLADETRQRVAMAYSSPAMETTVALFQPGMERARDPDCARLLHAVGSARARPFGCRTSAVGAI